MAVSPGKSTPVRPPPLLLSVDDARLFCGGVAAPTWIAWSARGLVPAPIRVGVGRGRVFWRKADLEVWVEAGCPPRTRFEEIMEARSAKRSLTARPAS